MSDQDRSKEDQLFRNFNVLRLVFTDDEIREMAFALQDRITEYKEHANDYPSSQQYRDKNAATLETLQAAYEKITGRRI